MASSPQLREIELEIHEVAPRDLYIVWGNDKRYWLQRRQGQQDEKGPAELLQVCWLEVGGAVNVDADRPDPTKKDYQVGFEVSLTQDAFGWSSATAVYVMAKRGKSGTYVRQKVSLAGLKPNRKITIPVVLPAAEFSPPDDKKIHFGLYEVWSGMWKGGLLIHRAFVNEIKRAS